MRFEVRKPKGVRHASVLERRQVNVRPSPFLPRAAQAYLLIDCLVYIALLLVLLSLAFLTFYKTLDNSKNLNRNAADVARALNAGERWRADVRASTAPPRLEPDGGNPVLHLPHATNEVLYTFRDGSVLRKDTARTNADWEPALPAVKASRMLAEARPQVTAWRWELELVPPIKTQRMKPLFTFQAVPAGLRKP